MMDPKVYIITLNFNGAEDTIDLVRSLDKCDYKNWKLCIVDNGSKKQDIASVIKNCPSHHYIKNNHNEGFTQGNNQGIEYALSQKDCDYILIINNDTIIGKDTIHVMIHFLEKNPKTVISPVMVFYGTNTIQSTGLDFKPFLGGLFNKNLNKSYNELTEDIYPDGLTGCCIASSKANWNKIGGFDNRYFAYLEDADWSFRARSLGFTLVTLKDAVIQHKHSRTSSHRTSGSHSLSERRNSPFKVYMLTRNHILFAKKNLKGITKITFIASHLVFNFCFNLLLSKSFYFTKFYFKGIRDSFLRKFNPPEI